ncbi:MAG: bifunctional oligoribonuclease/PAP phosphatase NrnA [Flavobacteriales bacterium]|nr:bifunctional oligoribonuclease/PAP phosphatase NrnA [Flavobacteriales bacterium]
MSFTSVPEDQLEKLQVLLDKPKRLAIVSHFNPDGDAIGSSLGLMHVLRSAGHTVNVVMPNTPATFLDWLPGRKELLCFDASPDASASTIRTSDILFCLDFNRLDRIGALEQAARKAPLKVLIDHHQDPDDFADASFSDISASSTCQMVYDIVKGLGLSGSIGSDAATCLYTGLVTDSGSFRYRSTTPHTMRVAADLMERGVDIDHVHGAIMDTNSEDRLKLLGYTLSEGMTVHHELCTAVLALSKEQLARFNFQAGDTEGFVNYGLSIMGMRLSAFFVERPDLVKISLRSKGDLPVDRFLKEHFNGGGHANAAGGRSELSLQATVDRFMALLPAFLDAHPV